MWIRYDCENKGITGKILKKTRRALQPISVLKEVDVSRSLLSFSLCLILERNWNSSPSMSDSGEPSGFEVEHQTSALLQLPHPFLDALANLLQADQSRNGNRENSGKGFNITMSGARCKQSD